MTTSKSSRNQKKKESVKNRLTKNNKKVESDKKEDKKTSMEEISTNLDDWVKNEQDKKELVRIKKYYADIVDQYELIVE